jgi:uncharacterized protein (DUF433 family)
MTSEPILIEASDEDARAMVVVDPGIMGGAPVIRGTRVPVHDIAASLAVGVSRERIRAAYPGLDDRMIDLAARYVAIVGDATPSGSTSQDPRSEWFVVERKTVARRGG